MVSSDHYDPPTALSRSVAVLAHRYRSAAAQPQGGHSKAYCADGQSGQFVSVVRHGELRLTQRKTIGTVLSRDETTFTPGCLRPLNVGAGTSDNGHWRDKSIVPIAKQNVSIKPQRIVANAPHFEEVQVKQSHAVSTVSFQAHAFSDGESIHLKLPGGLVSISSDAQQPSGHPYLHARARAPFRIKPEAAG